MVIVFDVMGTLLNASPLAPFIRRATGGKLGLRQFFDEVSTYVMASTLSGDRSASFEAVACSVLQMNASVFGREVKEKELAAFRAKLGAMPPFPDVIPNLKRLKQRGLRMAALSNANAELLASQVKRAKVDSYFEHAISVETLGGSFKPARQVYDSALEQLGGHPHELLMVAAHGWDLLGAAAAGYRTAFIARPGTAPYPGIAAPHSVSQNLTEFVDQLLGTAQDKSEKTSRTPHWLASAGLAVGLAVVNQRLSQRLAQRDKSEEQPKSRSAGA